MSRQAETRPLRVDEIESEASFTRGTITVWSSAFSALYTSYQELGRSENLNGRESIGNHSKRKEVNSMVHSRQRDITGACEEYPETADPNGYFQATRSNLARTRINGVRWGGEREYGERSNRRASPGPEVSSEVRRTIRLVNNASRLNWRTSMATTRCRRVEDNIDWYLHNAEVYRNTFAWSDSRSSIQYRTMLVSKRTCKGLGSVNMRSQRGRMS